MNQDLYRELGKKIKTAREELGMSQAQLAEQLGYNSPATISHFEAGQRKISIQDLHKISEALGYPMGSFLDIEEQDSKIQRFRLRATKIRPAAREEVASFLAYVHENNTKEVKPLFDASNMRPGQAANKILEMAGHATPPIDPADTAEELGISIYHWEFPDEVSGIYVWDNNKASIGINRYHPYVRQRFTTAHEVGHFVFHREDMFMDFYDQEISSNIDNVQDQKKEIVANQFAADLLMPMRAVKKDFDKYGESGLDKLAKKYEVSEQAMWFRLLNLRLIDEEDIDQ